MRGEKIDQREVVEISRCFMCPRPNGGYANGDFGGDFG